MPSRTACLIPQLGREFMPELEEGNLWLRGIGPLNMNLDHQVSIAKQARAIIEQRTGIRRGCTQVRHFLKDRLGFRWRRTGAIPVPPKKTIAEHAREQAAFFRDKD